MTSSLQEMIESVLIRDLGGVRRELEVYPEERLIWSLPPGLPNSGGTLALHVAGNLQHYIGALLGGSGYVRDRENEFAARDLGRNELLRQIARAETAVRSTLPELTEARLSAAYPEPVGGCRLETSEFLVHLAVHLGYHLGQLSYHRRVVTGDAGGVGALSPRDLGTAR